MADAANILNNTVLIPYHDSLVANNPLDAYDPGEKLKNIKTGEVISEGFEYGAYIKLKDGNSVKMIAVQEVAGFGMEREFEQRAGSSGAYMINLPGAVKYSDLAIKHLYTREKFFLDWLTNGVSQGGAARIDMELHFIIPQKTANGTEKKHIVFVLYDAFPVSWEIGPLEMTGGKNLFETVKIAYSWLQYRTA